MALSAAFLAVPAAYAGTIDFERDIRPVLSNACFTCHGPDEEALKADLRLDLEEEAKADLGGYAAVVPGDPDASALYQRITSDNPRERMPPESSGKELTPEQIGLFRQWIAEGADWPAHWAFAAPERPAVPAVSRPDWVRNPIDNFVLARLDTEGLAPAPEADATTLLRRLHLDLTGLPPTLQDIDAFLALDRETAYTAATERLLASPHYGERFARDWLDAAQYADSDGFEKDKPRSVWHWRDWVIDAFNANLPYDEFVRRQVAGDLLPGATQRDIVATGFLRNSMINEEGGADPEQFRMEAMFNRVDVLGRAVLGLTVSCAQCHTHKYDPLSHREYFQLLAYLNSTHEAQPTVYTPAERAQRDAAYAEIAAIDVAVKAEAPDWAERQAQWETHLRALPQPAWHTVALSFDDTASGGQKWLPQEDGSYRAAGYAPTRFYPKMAGAPPLETITALRLDLLTDPNLPRNGPGRSVYGSGALSEIEIRVGEEGQPFETFDSWPQIAIASAIADVNPRKAPLGPEYPDKEGSRDATTGGIAFAIDGDHLTAWTTDNGPERRNQPRYAIFTLAEPLVMKPGQQLGVKLIQLHGGWNSDDNQSNNLGRFKISVTDAAELPEEAPELAVLAAAQRAPETRSDADHALLFRAWRMTEPRFLTWNVRSERAWAKMPQGATQLVYQEMDTPRTTHRLARGDFQSPAEAVQPGVPKFLNPLPEGAPANRLGLAQWLTDRRAPTTARAFVNRLWQHYFGTGLVASAADFGLQGDPPSHPELLDWLAVEFMDSGWDIKHLQRLIVGSATYRQASAVSPELRERDPANRLLARGARFRVPGESVRDIALAASGLLNPQVGGPSVYPEAPAFLFEPPASYGPKPWPTAQDEQRHRRALYTFRYRSVPHPVLQSFDAPPGDAPCTRRTQSNTPLQALTALNEPGFVEAAQALAARTLAEGGPDDAARIGYAFRRCTARTPAPEETQVLLDFLAKQRARIACGELEPAALLRNTDTPDAELAAWMLLSRVMLNLDETITRE